MYVPLRENRSKDDIPTDEIQILLIDEFQRKFYVSWFFFFPFRKKYPQYPFGLYELSNANHRILCVHGNKDYGNFFKF